MLKQTKSHSNLTSKLRKRARQAVSRMVNTQLTMLHWKIGKRINEEVLKNERAEYGEAIIATVSQQLSWSHFVEIIPLKNDLERTFYTQMCRIEKWSVRTLRKKIRSMLFERTAISQKPEELARLELQLDQTKVKVAQYITKFLPKDLLKRKLHQFLEASRKQLDQM